MAEELDQLVENGLGKLSSFSGVEKAMNPVRELHTRGEWDLYDPRSVHVIEGMNLLQGALETVDKRAKKSIGMNDSLLSEDILNWDTDLFTSRIEGITDKRKAVEILLETTHQVQKHYNDKWQDINNGAEQDNKLKFGESIASTDFKNNVYYWELRRAGIEMALQSNGIQVDNHGKLQPGISLNDEDITNKVRGLPDKDSYFKSK